ncbi:hypothetical protein OG948_52170 (plasmid) [Embleya sp. NBC_00888]|uniref:hypothetical protein n=1 Tax=Embleya sp. NBC_00888 TaxID=2975960 RepID=UPI002F916DA6|nr:hypothetical protein OG948_52170 [Embleya sp. NBC_00888]
MDEVPDPALAVVERALGAGPYTAPSMSRLRISDLAAHTTSRALTLVAVDRDEVDVPARALALVETARAIERLAAELLTATVVHARTVGAGWDEIGDAVEVTRPNASIRFGPAAADWLERSAGPDGLPRVPMYRSPEHLADYLDRWAAERGGPERAHPDSRAVSAGLRRLDMVEELALLRTAANTRVGADALPLRDLSALHTREADLLERLADSSGASGENGKSCENGGSGGSGSGEDDKPYRSEAEAARLRATELARLLAIQDAAENDASRAAYHAGDDEGPPSWAARRAPQIQQALAELPTHDGE